MAMKVTKDKLIIFVADSDAIKNNRIKASNNSDSETTNYCPLESRGQNELFYEFLGDKNEYENKPIILNVTQLKKYQKIMKSRIKTKFNKIFVGDMVDFESKCEQLIAKGKCEIASNMFLTGARPYLQFKGDENWILFKSILYSESSSIVLEKKNNCYEIYPEFHPMFMKITDEIEEDVNKLDEIKTVTPPSNFKHNRILFGAPGTGKSYQLNKDKDELLGIDSNNYERVTFHPDYSYANFVGCYKPVSVLNQETRKKEIEYKYVPGPFLRTLVKAIKSANSYYPQNYLLIIEEINRANVAAVFGDVFQLLDRKNGVSEYPIQTPEDMRQYLADKLGGNPDNYETIRIPNNMYIWATMNSADQGVFPMDTAFKRRWDFTYLDINNNEEKIDDRTITINGDQCKWNDVRKSINDYLSDMNINEDKLMGPFFINPKDINDDNFDEVFKNKVLMYLFEDAGKQRRSKLFKNNMNIYSEICKEYDKNKFEIFADEILQSIDDYQK